MRFIAGLAALLLLAVSSGAGGAEMRQDGQGRWVNEAGGNPLGDSRFNLMADPTFNLGADPAYNSDVDPRFNLQADPLFNPRADPKFNPMGDPSFDPMYDGGAKKGGTRPQGAIIRAIKLRSNRHDDEHLSVLD
ncbi:MAG: hypothetical protein IH926_09575 [Proteobacteria bacterium]|nr:hypothetical protein [Pseudomonadota bacterium]